MQTLKDFIEHAQAEFKEHGGLTPSLIVEDVNEVRVLFVFAMSDSADKHGAMKKAGVTAKNDGELGEVKRIIFTTEAWLKTFPKDTDLSQLESIKNYPDKKEVLVATSLDAGGKFEILTSQVIRSGDYIDFSQPKNNDEGMGDPMILKKFWEGYRE